MSLERLNWILNRTVSDTVSKEVMQQGHALIIFFALFMHVNLLMDTLNKKKIGTY